MNNMTSPKPVTVSKAAKSKAMRSVLSSKNVRVTPMTSAQRRAAGASKSKS